MRGSSSDEVWGRIEYGYCMCGLFWVAESRSPVQRHTKGQSRISCNRRPSILTGPSWAVHRDSESSSGEPDPTPPADRCRNRLKEVGTGQQVPVGSPRRVPHAEERARVNETGAGERDPGEPAPEVDELKAKIR